MQVGILEHEMPAILYSRKEYMDATKHYKGIRKCRRTVTHKYRGICSPKDKMILINVKHNNSTKQLRRTIVHELIHYRFHYLKHGVRFEERIDLVLRGKKYKIKSLYPEISPPPTYLNTRSNNRFNLSIRLQRIIHVAIPSLRTRLIMVMIVMALIKGSLVFINLLISHWRY